VADGFFVPEAKTSLSWIDDNSIFIGTNFGPGSLTASGYPRIAKRWKRGTPLSAAETVFEAEESDLMAFAYHDSRRGFERDIIYRVPSTFTFERFVLNRDGSRTKIEVPADADIYPFREWLLISLRTPWTIDGHSYPSGALLAARFDDFIAGSRELTLLHEPSATTSRADFSWTRSHLILSVLDDVKTKAWALAPGPGEWKREALEGIPKFGTTGIWPVDSEDSDDYFMDTTDSLTPTTLFIGRVGRRPEKLKTMPVFFNADGLETTQHLAVSDDGTRVPYFQVSAQGLSPDGSHPTILSGYGGFELPMLPYYSGVTGRAWLEQGGIYVLANIRGGGEYGPRWHQAALKANRPRAHEDFAAVARDLISRGVTSPARLGISGGSNGGLLVGNMLIHYPELFGAAVCSMPLLDMKRYSHLLAGASWMDEYGDPDKPEEWQFIREFSPYHNIKPGAAYPPVLFMTTTRDDRVHPGHARKMAALMQDLGYKAYFWENTEGGHGAGADNRQLARFFALEYEFMWSKLK
jgi:prolyl oligopeptidase